jgi:ABC-type polysaccharide/polyol phosphate transport system ATPase subunit
MFCDRALLLECGRIIMAGPAAEVAETYLSLLTEDEARMELATINS